MSKEEEEKSKVNTWMRKRAADCIALGWTLSYGTGSSVIISPNLCEKLKNVSEKTKEPQKDEK